MGSRGQTTGAVGGGNTLAETMPAGTYEEKPKVNWFLWVAAAFFVIMIMAIWELPNGTMKWAWMGIAVLNLSANMLQINNTRKTRYVLWKRGLSIYLVQSREALIRFDKTLMFRPWKGMKDAKEDITSFGVRGPLRAYPTFGSRRRWLVIFEREDGTVQGLVFDPTPKLEAMFRDRLLEAEAARPADEDEDEALEADVAVTPAATQEEKEWEEEEAPAEAREDAPPAGDQPGGGVPKDGGAFR